MLNLVVCTHFFRALFTYLNPKLGHFVDWNSVLSCVKWTLNRCLFEEKPKIREKNRCLFEENELRHFQKFGHAQKSSVLLVVRFSILGRLNRIFEGTFLKTVGPYCALIIVIFGI